MGDGLAEVTSKARLECLRHVSLLGALNDDQRLQLVKYLVPHQYKEARALQWSPSFQLNQRSFVTELPSQTVYFSAQAEPFCKGLVNVLSLFGQCFVTMLSGNPTQLIP